jgi:sulfite reductase beta subunit-like hemoprotein/Arc/MetJ-type ribon-helix-helix transcriptional regulator
MSKGSAEEIKLQSQGLRGNIAGVLADANTSHFEDVENVLLKFHGTYQQDDRDKRAQLAKEKKEKAWSFMVRSKMPGGRCTAEQWMIHDRLAEKTNDAFRLTTRQGIQLHGVLKGNLKEVIGTINRSGLTTIGACGDVVRNTMGPASPIKDYLHLDAQQLAEEMSRRFLWKSSGYSEIWLDGEKLPHLSECQLPADQEDPIFGKVWLPRKFKIGIAIPPRNDVDVYSNDVGLVPHGVNGVVEGYSIFVGGGFGMSHGQVATRPFLARPLGYVKRADVVETMVAIVTTQRDFGNREDRKQARLKYLVESKGIEWFRAEVQSRVPNIEIAPAKEVKFETVEDDLGWHEQGDGKWFCAVYVSQGRVKDTDGPRYRKAFREIAESLKLPFVITPNANIIIADISAEQRASVTAIIAKHGIPFPSSMTAAHKVAHACVALPTCGLSLSESERVFGGVMDGIDVILRELKLEDEPILFRMTGCPNGCARPYNADIGFVGRAPGKYAMYVGGSIRGDRLAGLEKKVVALADIPATVRPMLEDFAKNRKPNERFTDFWGRTRENGEAPTSDHFHVEFAERAAKTPNGHEAGGAEGLPAPAAKPAAPAAAKTAPAIVAAKSEATAAAPAELAVRPANGLTESLITGDGVSIKLPGELQRFVQSRTSPNGLYGSVGEYFRDLVRRDFEREEQRQWTWRTHEVRKGSATEPADFAPPVSVNVVVEENGKKA